MSTTPTGPYNKSTDNTLGPLSPPANDVRDEMKTFYKKGLLKYAEKRTVFSQFGQAATIPRNQGQIYEWRNVSQISKVTGAAQPTGTLITEGVTPTGSSLTFTKLTATIAQYGDYYAGTDLLDATIYDPIRTLVVDAQSYQMAQVMDNLIQIAAVTAATNRQYSNAGGGTPATTRATLTQTDVLSGKEIRKVVRLMRRNSVKPLRNGNFVAVIHPDTTYSMFQDTEIHEAMVNSKMMKGGDNAANVFTGEIGEYYGCTFIETELSKVCPKNTTTDGVTNSTTVDTYVTPFFGADYFGKIKLTDLNSDSIFKDMGSGGTEDPLDQRWTQGWKMNFGARILFPLYAVIVEHANAL